MEWFKIVQIVFMVLSWFESATDDGQVTEQEIAQLATMAGFQIGFPITPVEMQTIFGLIAKFRGKPLVIKA